MFWSARKRFKSDSNDYKIDNVWFRVTCIILCNLQNTNLQISLENSVLCNFQTKTCLNQHNKPRKIIYMIKQLIMSDLGCILLFCVIDRIQIRRFWLQRQFLAIFSLIINKIKERTKKQKKIQNIFASI